MQKTTKFDYNLLIADLEAKKKVIEDMISNFKMIQNISELPSSGLSSVSSAPVISAESIPNDAFFGLDIIKAIKKYLTIVKRPAPLKDIADALLKGGFTSRSSNFYKTTHTMLYRQKDAGDIVKVNKEWGLKEWYGLKK